jgi:hypothetical protein
MDHVVILYNALILWCYVVNVITYLTYYHLCIQQFTMLMTTFHILPMNPNSSKTRHTFLRVVNIIHYV